MLFWLALNYFLIDLNKSDWKSDILDWSIWTHCSNYGLLYYLYSISIIASKLRSAEHSSRVFVNRKKYETLARYWLISNSLLEYLISFVLRNTGRTKLYTHIKEFLDNHSCYEFFRKITGIFFRLRSLILLKYLWKGSCLQPETFPKCDSVIGIFKRFLSYCFFMEHMQNATLTQSLIKNWKKFSRNFEF